MEVGVGVAGEIVVDGKVDTLDINTTSEDVGSNTDTLVKLLELRVALDTRVLLDAWRIKGVEYKPLFLADTRVNCDRREVTLAEELVELSGA